MAGIIAFKLVASTRFVQCFKCIAYIFEAVSENQIMASLEHRWLPFVFEFLVAQALSKKFKREDHFLINLPRDFRARLQFYEETIREFDSDLLKNLPTLSENVAENLEKYFLFNGKTNINFTVIGKLVATNDNDLWNETDIVVSEDLSNGDFKKYFLSLKLTKDHCFTNTKSAGIKSFTLINKAESR